MAFIALLPSKFSWNITSSSASSLWRELSRKALINEHLMARIYQLLFDVDHQDPYRNRKGSLSDGSMLFWYEICTGAASWEGSAADSTVVKAAERSGFHITRGRYYLDDAGYANTSNYIASFWGVWYHLREFAHGNRVPLKAKKKLFNLRHSSLQSAIERIFGVVKSQFPILKNASHHSYDNTTKKKCYFMLCST